MFAKVILFCVVVSIALADHPGFHNNHYPPQPYNFGYNIKDLHGSQFRKEQGNGNGQVQGSYGYIDDSGIQREVHYVADQNGFRAQIKTNEPGTYNKDPADVHVHSNAVHQVHQVHHQLGHNGYHHQGYQHHG